MHSDIHSPLYSYFRPFDSPWSFPYKFEASEQPTSELNNHIGRLIQSRDSLYGRYRQHTSIYSLPYDILSQIFEKVIDPGPDLKYENFHVYQDCIRHALVLCSVSLHFREVGLETPELWRRLPLWIKREKMEDNNALFRHSVPRALSLDLHISLRGSSQRESMELHYFTMAVLASSGALSKTKVLDVSQPTLASPWWVGLLSSFPNLDTLTMYNEVRWVGDGRVMGYDLQGLPSLTQISIRGGQIGNFIFPSSVQILHLQSHAPTDELRHILYGCPNLLECSLDRGGALTYRSNEQPIFNDPLILDYLKRLTWRMDFGLQTIPSIQKLRLPSLKYLNLHSDYERYTETPLAIILLCDRVSTTLTTLVLCTGTNLWTDGHLRRLVNLPLHKLETLEFTSSYSSPILSLIHALNPEQDETEMMCLPNLRFLTLQYVPIEHHQVLDDIRFAPLLVHLLERRTSGETSLFYLTLDVDGEHESVVDFWPAHWRHILFSMVNSGKLRLVL